MRTRRVPRSLLWLLYLYIASLPLYSFSFYWQQWRVIRPDWFFGALLVIFFMFNVAVGRIGLRSNSVNGFVLLYLCVGLLTAINLFNGTNAQFVDFGTKAIQLLLVIAVFFVISSLPLRDRELKNVLKVWFLVSFIIAVYAIYQVPARLYNWPLAYLNLGNRVGEAHRARKFAIGSDGLLSGRRLTVYSYVQVSSFFEEPTWLGSYLLSALVLFGGLILSGRGHSVLFRDRCLNRFFLVVLFLAFLLSLAVGPYLSLMATLGVICITGYFNRSKIIRLVLLLLPLSIGVSIILLVVLDINLFPIILNRIAEVFTNIIYGYGGGSFDTRLGRSIAALRVWISNPILGVGLNNTHFYTGEGFPLINNGWVALLSDRGIIGFVSMLLVIWSLLHSLNYVRRRVATGFPSWWYFLVVGLFFMVISDAIDTVITFNWTHPLRWFGLAMANLVCLRARERVRAGCAEEFLARNETSPRAGKCGDSY